MLVGLSNQAGPTLNVPVPDSKDRNSETKSGNKFSDILDSKTDRILKKDDVMKADPEKTKLKTDSVQAQPVKKPEKVESVESQEDSEVQTEDPLDPKVMDPRTSALREQRNRAIRKFMDSFEGEFGIPPEEMVEAMSQLTTQDLEEPPEKTVDNLIAELDLPVEDEAKAKKMYLGLLTQLNQIDTRAAMPRPQDDLLSQLSAQRIQLSADKKDVVAGQVQGLSDKFWMKGEATPVMRGKAAAIPEMNQLQVKEFLQKMVTTESAGLEDLQMPQMEGLTSTEDFMKTLEVEAEIPEGTEEVISTPEGDLPFVPQVEKGKSTQQQSLAQDQQAPPELMFKGPITKEAVQAELKKLGIEPMKNMQSKKTEKVNIESMTNLDMGLMSQIKPDAMTSVLPVTNVQPTVDMSPVQKTENIQQIMNQAQILLKKGGGEVKVEMTPEGMGSIQMKLQVLNGKVQIHMNTETKEAKNLIESSMHDLKQSLSAHQLSMDLVKVDVVNQTHSSQNAQNDTQSQMQNFLNQQQKDGTKQFWQQFNENFGNRQARDNFIDAQNIKGPVRNQLLPGFEGASSNGRARTDGRGKSLNLVA